MTKSNIITGIIAVLALILGGIGLVGGNQSVLGGDTNYDTISAAAVQVGPGCGDDYSSCTGTNLAFVKATTCNLVGGAIAATSSAAVDCAVTGVVSGDLVVATLATSSVNVVLTGARASSTAGFVTMRLLNLTGSTLSTVTSVGTSTTVFVFRATN